MPIRVEDAKGNVVWRAEHIDAYGVVEVAPGSSVVLRLRFAGHFLDEHTGLFYNRFRDYEPSLGRYLQPDPIDLRGGINLYAYPANPVVDVDLRGLIHKAVKKPSPSPDDDPPPHRDTPLNDMTDEQMQDVCRHHADRLADAQDSRPEWRNQTTFSVGVIEDAEGNRRLAATINDGKPTPAAREHMRNNAIEDRTDTPPRLARRPVRDESGEPVRDANGRRVNETVNADTGEVHDKKTRSDHHAEQRMERVPGEGERVVAQAPSQNCCPKCRTTLGQPDANGNRPLDKIPEDRRGEPNP
jgi:RHS repeat-associated protein